MVVVVVELLLPLLPQQQQQQLLLLPLLLPPLLLMVLLSLRQSVAGKQCWRLPFCCPLNAQPGALGPPAAQGGEEEGASYWCPCPGPWRPLPWR